MTASLRARRCLKGHSDGVSHVAALPEGRALSVSEDNTLRLWDIASGRRLRVLKGHSGSVRHVAALPDGRALSASSDNTLRLWDIADGKVIGGLISDSPISCLAISESIGVGVCGHADGKVTFFRVGPKS